MDKYSQKLWKGIFTIIFRGIYRTTVIGKEKFPLEGPLIVAPNHRSNLDPCLMGYACRRHVAFMAKEELFKNPIIGFFCRWLGAFPLKRGGVDKIAIRHAMGILKEGKVLGIFPEGTRQKEQKLGRFHDGVASMALRTGVPVLPVALIGTREKERHGMACVFGDPIPVEKAKPTAENIAAFNKMLAEKIQALMDEYRETKGGTRGNSNC